MDGAPRQWCGGGCLMDTNMLENNNDENAVPIGEYAEEAY